jgi:hypothetical protein
MTPAPRFGHAAVTAIVLLGALIGCGGEPPPAPPSDETLSRDTRAGRLAYLQERPDEAIAQYRAALVRAQARDDIVAIGDLGYNLAVAELRANAPARAGRRSRRCCSSRRPRTIATATPPPPTSWRRASRARAIRRPRRARPSCAA